MDPLAYLVNQNRQEVNRRTGHELRTQVSKEAEEKSRRRGLSESELASDLSTMSDDMLGDMDPDLFGKGGSTPERRGYDEEGEDDLERDESEDEHAEHQDPYSDDELEDGDGEPAPPAENAVEKGHLLERPLENWEDLADDADLEGFQDETEAPAWPVSEGAEKGPEESCLEEGRPLTGRLRGGSGADDQDTAPARTARPQAAGPPVLSPPVAASVPSGISFDPSHGFLIAEEFRAEAEALPQEAEPEVEQEALIELAPEMSELLDKLIIGDLASHSYRKLQSLLSRFGKGVLNLCLQSGTKVYLLPESSGLTSHPLLGDLDLTVRDGAYLASARACIFESYCLSHAPYGFHPVLFYFGYAFDHALGGEDFASLRSPAVRASHQACLTGAQRFADPLTALSPVHYFAQAIESYLAENDCEEPAWTRQDLYDFDRPMFDYVDYLFKRQNR